MSDTHRFTHSRPLPAALMRGLAGCDVIFHAGDMCVGTVLTELERLAPVFAVYGNNDVGDLLESLPECRVFTCGPHRVGLMHGHHPRLTAREHTLDMLRGLVDCAVYGHSHRPEAAVRDGLLMVNPGSPTQPRFEPHPTYAVIHVRNEIDVTIIAL